MSTLVERVEPVDLEAYLRTFGWSRLQADARRSIWRHQSGAQVFVPAERLTDYNQLVDLAVTEIAHAEGKPEDDVVSDLIWRQYDKLYIRHSSPSSSLSLEEAIEFHGALGDLIVAAALASWEPRASYAGRRPSQVMAYIERVRLIPSVPGSFVARALLPLDTLTGTPLPMVGPAEPGIRHVSTTILKATDAAVESAQAVVAGEPMTRWSEAVNEGVSANLCDALARLVHAETDAAAAINLHIDWTWEAPDEPMPEISIPSGLGPVLEYASDLLRGGPQEHAITITGLITHLHREKAAGPGEITVRGYIEQWDASSRSLRLELDEGSYRQAIAAHDTGGTVRVTALVRRAARTLEVVRVIDLDLLGARRSSSAPGAKLVP